MKKKLIILSVLALTIFAFILEVIPFSVIMYSGTQSGQEILRYYGYWSMMPAGYGNFCYFFVFITTCLLLLFIPLSLFINKKAFQIVIICLFLFGITFSIIPLFVAKYSTWQNYTVLVVYCLNFVIVLLDSFLIMMEK